MSVGDDGEEEEGWDEETGGEEVADGERGCGRRVEEGDQSPISRGSVTRGGAGLCLPQVFFCDGPAGRPPIHHHNSIQDPASVCCPGHTHTPALY